MIKGNVPGSFRDSSGYVYSYKGIIRRTVNKSYKKNYNSLYSSGLYRKLIKKKYMVKHEESPSLVIKHSDIYKDIIPENIPFISYPYEWSFSQLKDAGLLTLDIQLLALECNMTIKDASAYNIQYKNGKPIFIDTLSFEEYEDGKPWVAYQQFCQHFLAPLAIMSKNDIRLLQLLKTNIDGIPMDLASKLLPKKTFLSFGILFHIHLHAIFQNHYSDKQKTQKKIRRITKIDLINICESLKSLITKFNWNPIGTEWSDYYKTNNNYELETMKFKEKFVSLYVSKVSPTLVWDLGANTGNFSRLSSSKTTLTISFDIDPACVELNYLEMKKNKEQFMLPLLLDLTNPSPAIGWENTERQSVYQRKNPNLIMALALVHHLVISNNIPLIKIADLFSQLSRYLIIEFVPKSDTMVKKLLSTRPDIFIDYNKKDFEKIFLKFYKIIASQNVLNSQRFIYFMERI